jgi:uncharacterized membrane protein
MYKSITTYPVTASIWISTLILFVCSSVRHWLYQSGAFDLGWFDQAVYLISTGQNPIVSFSGFHILGDHAAVILYPLALFYWIYPDVHWLFAIQAIALSIGGLPIYYLSRQAGIDRHQATTIVFAYLLYPLILNKSLFDFHPEVIAVPGFLIAVLAARNSKVVAFYAAILIILSCKAVLSVTVIAMGWWLIVFEKKRNYGAIAITAGSIWFVVSTQFIIPIFSGGEAAAVSRYSYLGSSVIEIAKNLFIKPNLVLSKVCSLDTLEYIFYLTVPVIWGLSPKYLSPLLSAIPMLLMNILSTSSAQRSLVFQYSLPILPFLFIVVINTVANDRNWLKTRRNILIWSTISFILLGKIGYFWSTYLSTLDTHKATTAAIGMIRDTDPILTIEEIAPHLTHRQSIKLAFIDNGSESMKLKDFKHILLNQRHPGYNSSIELIEKIKTNATRSGLFKLEYQQDEVYLFIKK